MQTGAKTSNIILMWYNIKILIGYFASLSNLLFFPTTPIKGITLHSYANWIYSTITFVFLTLKNPAIHPCSTCSKTVISSTFWWFFLFYYINCNSFIVICLWFHIAGCFSLKAPLRALWCVGCRRNWIILDLSSRQRHQHQHLLFKHRL